MSNSTRNIIGFILLCSALSSTSGLVAPVSPENLESGFDLGAIFSHTPTTFFFITVALLSAGMISLLISSRAYWLTILCIGNLLLLLLFVMVSNQQVGPSAHWYFRSPVTVIVATIAVSIASFAGKNAAIMPLNKGSLSYFYASLALALIVSANSAIGWTQYMNRIEFLVNSSNEKVDYSALELTNELNLLYSGTWSTETLSIVLRYGPTGASVSNEFPELVDPDHYSIDLIEQYPRFDKAKPYWSQ